MFDTSTLPTGLLNLIDLSSIEEIEVGMSIAHVLKARSSSGSTFFLKMMAAQDGEDLRDECARLLWLRGRLPVPEVVYFAELDGTHYLLLTAVLGVASCEEHLRDRVLETVRIYGESLRRIHALPVNDCPFDQRLSVKVSAARRRLESLHAQNQESSEHKQAREEAFTQMLTQIPEHEDLAVTHGDFCMPNVLLEPQSLAIAGFVDWSRAGVADRYQDLALAARSIEFNLGEQWVQPFLDAYGLDVVDMDKLEFFKTLDEF